MIGWPPRKSMNKKNRLLNNQKLNEKYERGLIFSKISYFSWLKAGYQIAY